MSQQDRFFTTISDSAQSCINLSSAVTLGQEDWELSFDFVGDAATPLISGSDNANALNVALSSGNVRAFVRVNGTLQPVIATSGGGFADGRLHRVKITYTEASDVVTLNVNGNDVDSDTWSLDGSQTFSTIGHRPQNSTYHTNIIANVKVDKGGVTTLDLPIDQNYTPSSNVVEDESASENDGTFVNVSDGDSIFFTKRSDGDFEDAEGNILELAFQEGIIIPVPQRFTLNTLASHLRTQGFSGSDNDVIISWLRSEGYIGTLNGALNSYLEEVEALQNSFTDKYATWRSQ